MAFVGNTPEVSNIVRTTLKDAAIDVGTAPYLREASELALEISNIAQGAKSNKNAFQRLAAVTCELVYVVLCIYKEASKKGGDHSPPAKFVGDLLGTLSSIKRFSRKEAFRGWLFRFFGNKNDLRKIQEFCDTLGLFRRQCNAATREAAYQVIDQHEKIPLELQGHREKDTAATSVAAPAPAPVERENAPVAPIAPETSKPFGTVTHIGGDNIESHSINSVTSMNSGNTIIATTSNSNNDNSYRQYGGKPGRGPCGRGRRE